MTILVGGGLKNFFWLVLFVLVQCGGGLTVDDPTESPFSDEPGSFGGTDTGIGNGLAEGNGQNIATFTIDGEEYTVLQSVGSNMQGVVQTTEDGSYTNTVNLFVRE